MDRVDAGDVTGKAFADLDDIEADAFRALQALDDDDIETAREHLQRIYAIADHLEDVY